MPSVQEDGGLTPQEVRKLVDAERLKIAIRRQAKLEEQQADYAAYKHELRGRNRFAIKSFLVFIGVIAIGLAGVFWLPKLLGSDRGLRHDPVAANKE